MAHPEGFGQDGQLPVPNKNLRGQPDPAQTVGDILAAKATDYVLGIVGTVLLSRYNSESSGKFTQQTAGAGKPESSKIGERWERFDRSYEQIRHDQTVFDGLFTGIVNHTEELPETSEQEITALIARNEQIADLPNRLKELRKEKMGNSIYWQYKSAEAEGEITNEFIGIGLKVSTDPDEHRHLLVFNNGQMVVVKPSIRGDLKTYQGFMEDPTQAIFYEDTASGVDEEGSFKPEFLGKLLNGLYSAGSITVEAISTTYSQRGAVIAAADSALETIAFERKRRIAEAEDRDLLHNTYNGIVRNLDINADWVGERSKQKEEEAAASGGTEVLETVEQKIGTLMEMRASLGLLAHKGIGKTITREKTGTTDSSLYGKVIDLSEYTDVPSAIFVTRGSILVVEPWSAYELVGERFKNAVSGKTGSIALKQDSAHHAEETDHEVTTKQLTSFITNEIGEVMLASDKPEDLDGIVAAVAIAEKVIARQIGEKDALMADRITTLFELGEKKDFRDDPPAQAAA